jgi:hypothetical protein
MTRIRRRRCAGNITYSEEARPITPARIKRALDRLAEIIVQLGHEGYKYLPIYKRLETEFAQIRDRATDMVRLRAHAKRSRIEPSE